MRNISKVLLLAAALPLAACSSDVGSSSDFATDSFGKPTHHGELDFKADNAANFTESERFHGWSFTLSGDATVTLATDIQAANLDTVLYLYNATEDGKKTGRNLKTDDNGGDDGLSSLIEKDLEAGTYFIQVKTKNVAMRGRFDLEASCAGIGCPVDAPFSAEDSCWSAEEDFGKCMDDSLDATAEGCTPGGGHALVCCNSADGADFEWCSNVCDDGPAVSSIRSDDYDHLLPLWGEEEVSTLIDAYSLGVNNCANLSDAELGARIVAGTELVENDAFDSSEWIDRSSSDFASWPVTEEIVNLIDAQVGATAAKRFEARVEVPCPNCTNGFSVHGFYYPTIGKVVVLEENWGGDS